MSDIAHTDKKTHDSVSIPGSIADILPGGNLEMTPLGVENSTRGSSRILIADDEMVIANTLKVIMQHAGFEAHAVYTGQQAVDAIDTFEPDVLLSDVMMPGISGIEAAIQILARLPRCKVLLFSGVASSADLLEDARAQGYNFEILAKPVHPSDLLRRLRSTTSHSATSSARLPPQAAGTYNKAGLLSSASL